PRGFSSDNGDSFHEVSANAGLEKFEISEWVFSDLRSRDRNMTPRWIDFYMSTPKKARDLLAVIFGSKNNVRRIAQNFARVFSPEPAIVVVTGIGGLDDVSSRMNSAHPRSSN